MQYFQEQSIIFGTCPNKINFFYLLTNGISVQNSKFNNPGNKKPVSKTTITRIRETGKFFKLTSLLLILCFSEPVHAQYFGFKINSGKKSIRLDYDIYNNLVVIPVKVNNVIPLKFVMDTGVRSTIITDKVITDMLNLPYTRKIVINGPGDYNQLQAWVVSQVGLYLDGITGYDQTILVLEDDYLKLRNVLGVEVHGMIGYDIFNRFVMGFDFPGKSVNMIEPRKFIPPRGYDVLPLLVEDTKPYIWATVCIHDTTHIRVKLMIDTGASHSLLLKANPALGIKVPTANIHDEIGRGLGGVIEGSLAQINSLSFGKYTFHDVVASFPDPSSYPDSLSDAERNGTIGGEILSRFNVYFDYRHGKIYLRKNQNFHKKFGYNMSGLTITAEGQELNSYRIASVRDHSPAAEADIRPGDILLSLQGYGKKDLDLNDIYKIFNFDTNRTVTLTIDRNGTILKKQFLLKNML